MSRRISQQEYYLEMAQTAGRRTTCLRRGFGAIIVKNDHIVSTGYNGAPCGRKNCNDIGRCFRMENNIPSGTRYEACRSVHAEQNAIINASKEEMFDADMYLVGVEPDGTFTKHADCCSICKRMIINAGIKKVIFRAGDEIKEVQVKEWIENDDSLYMHDTY